jgi:tRNA pseudouridine(38-40) synthase
MEQNLHRIALGIQYDGTDFSGWQSQPHQKTVQDYLESAIKQFLGGHLPLLILEFKLLEEQMLVSMHWARLYILMFQ